MKVLIFIVFFLISILFPMKSFANNWIYPKNQSEYPYLNSKKDVVDVWNTYTSNCTSYVMWKINKHGLNFNNNPIGPNGKSTIMGNAGTWDENAASIGYTVNKTPKVGIPVNWEADSLGSGPVGHVAWVEEIRSNNRLFISEWNWNYGDGKYNEREVVRGDNFIHLFGNCSSAISGATISNGQSFICAQPAGVGIKVLPNSTFLSGSNVRLFIN